MKHEEVIGYWDEMNAPLGVGPVIEAAPRRRWAWLAFPALAVLAGVLAGAAPIAWRMVRAPGPVVAANGEGASRPVARSVAEAPREAPAETVPLRPAPASEVARQPSAPAGPPVGTDSRGHSAPEAETLRSGALIINVAEALAAAKLKGAPR